VVQRFPSSGEDEPTNNAESRGWGYLAKYLTFVALISVASPIVGRVVVTKISHQLRDPCLINGGGFNGSTQH
jgi:hypothetical protein